MKPATPEQKRAINAIIAKRGLMQYKADIIAGSTNNRTEHSSDLYFDEAHALLQSLITDKKNNTKLMSKLFAMAHEMLWIRKETVVVPNQCGELMTSKMNYRDLFNWIDKYGYLKKPLNDYTYEELPKLVSQFEFGPYKSFLNK